MSPCYWFPLRLARQAAVQMLFGQAGTARPLPGASQPPRRQFSRMLPLTFSWALGLILAGCSLSSSIGGARYASSNYESSTSGWLSSSSYPQTDAGAVADPTASIQTSNRSRSFAESANFFAETLEFVYESLRSTHVTPLDMETFTAAGLGAVGLGGLVLRYPTDGRRVGGVLDQIRTQNAPWGARNPQDTMESFLEAGLRASLGDVRFTTYLTPGEIQQFNAVIGGMSGVGIQVDFDPRGLIVTNVRSNSPAAEWNVRVGDRITHANGVPLSSISTLEERAEMLAGRVGETLRLQIAGDRGTRLITLVRVRQTVNEFQKSELRGRIGYIPLLVFDSSAAAYVAEAYATLAAQADLSGLILDLRDDSGGSVGQALEILDLFVEADRPLFRIGRANRQSVLRSRRPAAIPLDLPLVVLVNRNSASASELLAGALQDNRRAVILGSTTFGKGSQQVITALPNGGALAITNAFLFRADGRPLSYWGIVPNICGAQHDNPLRLVNQAVRGNLPNLPAIAQEETRRTEFRRLCAATRNEKLHDRELAEALLTVRSAYQAALF